MIQFTYKANNVYSITDNRWTVNPSIYIFKIDLRYKRFICTCYLLIVQNELTLNVIRSAYKSLQRSDLPYLNIIINLTITMNHQLNKYSKNSYIIHVGVQV